MTDDGEFVANVDNTNYKAISCEQIPELFLDKLVAKKHFSKFGKINRFILTPKRLSCTVEYETEEDAERAYLGADNFNGINFTVNFAENKVAHVQNTEEWVDPDVQAELDAMSPGHRAFAGASNSVRSSFGSSSMPKVAASVKMVAKPTPALPLAKPALRAGRTDSPQPDVPKIDASLRSELEAILRRPAFTDEDKYRVLDARDKLIRLKTVRQTDINKAVATRGSCPDMCPEKERLMREFQRQVATFEMADDDEDSPTTISHRKAIKEYSRSSADQEVPLSHELRSESVLQMTMLYLMHRVMDLCDDPQTSLGDWFHFVWDRTRSIRKDITQQELCSLGGVQLVEQCARFHIHCAARLVAEDPSVFDKKINAENLTKCLQTLKYLYHDLRIKGIYCPCESEFRSYIILLNLGDSNFLWELKQLPESIQKSPEIKRSIAFYNALQNNNFVKFFAMIRSKETSYLSACILLGYFNKLRLRAMEAIVKSHNRGRIDVFLPLSYLSRVLGFDDEDAAVNFFAYHGLQCDVMDDRVLLDRLSRPDMEYAMERALKLVESKRHVSVGECVYGLTLPPATTFEQHQPHSSFDSNGLLRPESWSADDQLRGDEARKKALENTQQQAMLPPPTMTATQTNTFKSPAAAIQASAFRPPETSVFKMPQASPPISPRQQQRQQQQKPVFDSFAADKEQTRNSSPGGFKFGSNLKDENRSSSPGGFKFGGNIFGGSTTANTPTAVTFKPVQDSATSSIFKATSESATSSIFKPVQQSTSASIFKPTFEANSTAESIFKLPATTVPPQQNNTNVFQTSIFKPTAEKTLPTGNIFGGFNASEEKPPSNNNSIFGSAAKETANIFQQQKTSTEAFRSDNLFQNFQTKPEMPIFGGFASTSQSQTVSAFKTTTTTAIQEMEQRKLKLEKEHELKQLQLEEEKRKLKELEEKRLREKRQQEERKQQEMERHRQEHLRQLCTQKAQQEQALIVNSIIQQEVAKIAQEELQRYETLQQASHLQRDQLLSEVLLSIVEEVANEEYAVMCYDQMILNRYFNRWLQHLRKKREQRKLMESTPLWVTTDTRAQFSQALEHPCQANNLGMIKRYRLGQPCDFKQLMQLDRHQSHDESLKPLCLFGLVGRHLLAKRNVTPSGLLQQRQYFKFVISIPSDKEELPGFETFCNKWLFKHIKKAQLETGPFVHGLVSNMALCVRKLSGIYPRNEQGDEIKNEGDHSDGVVCFISGGNFKSQARRRLYNLLYISKNCKKIPVAIIAYNCIVQKEEIVEMLALESLEDEGLLSSYKIFGHGVRRRDFSFRKAVTDAVNYITTESYAQNYTDIQALAMENILGFLDSSLGEEIWHRWQESSKMNPVFQKICQEPEYVEGIFHKALQHLIHITQEDFSEMPEFPEELKEFVPQQQKETNIPVGLEFFPPNWKDTKTKKVIYNFLKQLYLPSFKETVPNDVEALELWLLNYASKCVPHDDKAATKAAHAAIENLILQLRDPYLQLMAINERLKLINYLTILKPIIFAHINAILGQFHVQLKNAAVIYIRRDLKTYQTQPWWLNYQPLNLVNMDYTQKSPDVTNLPPETDAKENEFTTQQLDDIIAKAEETSRKVEKNLIAIKQKTTKKKHGPSAEALTLKRTLDETLYKFELSKKVGHYDTTYIDDLTHDIDVTIHEVLSHSPEDGGGKRKRLSLTSSSPAKGQKTNDVDDVIARAMQLIKKVESIEDRKEKIKTSNKIYWGMW